MSVWLSLMVLLVQVLSVPRRHRHLLIQFCWCCFPAEVPTAILMDLHCPFCHSFPCTRTRTISCTPSRKVDTWGVWRGLWTSSHVCLTPANIMFYHNNNNLLNLHPWDASTLSFFHPFAWSWNNSRAEDLTLMSRSTSADREHSKRGLMKHPIIPEEKLLFHPKVWCNLLLCSRCLSLAVSIHVSACDSMSNVDIFTSTSCWAPCGDALSSTAASQQLLWLLQILEPFQPYWNPLASRFVSKKAADCWEWMVRPLRTSQIHWKTTDTFSKSRNSKKQLLLLVHDGPITPTSVCSVPRQPGVVSGYIFQPSPVSAHLVYQYQPGR